MINGEAFRSIATMPRSFARSFVQLLRLPLMAALMLAALVNPVLMAVGDLHDAGVADSAHAHDVDDHDHDSDFADEDDQGSDLLHALMHASHCCGHLTAISTGIHVPDVVPARSGALVFGAADGVPHDFSDHFRPPIAV